jgi:asparagine N-glycosylation enzyme membrane subunit Stt3
MALPPIPELAVFMTLVLVLSLYGLTVSGHFPEEHRAATLRTVGGQILLWGTIGLCAALTVCALAFAWQRVPLYAAVIGGGFMVLIAPLLLQPLPDSFINGRWALLMFTCLGIGLGLMTAILFA